MCGFICIVIRRTSFWNSWKRFGHTLTICFWGGTFCGGKAYRIKRLMSDRFEAVAIVFVLIPTFIFTIKWSRIWNFFCGSIPSLVIWIGEKWWKGLRLLQSPVFASRGGSLNFHFVTATSSTPYRWDIIGWLQWWTFFWWLWIDEVGILLFKSESYLFSVPRLKGLERTCSNAGRLCIFAISV